MNAGSFAHPLLPALDVEGCSRPGPLVRAGLGAVAALLAGLALWAGLAPLSSAVIAGGVVKVDNHRKPVQHQEGGIVGEILVRDGSRVRAGQTLIVLRDVGVDASAELVRSQLDAELAKSARLAAEQSGAARLEWPEELASRRADPRVAEYLAREQGVFHVRREALASQLALLRGQAAAAREEVRAREAQLAADDQAIRIHREALETDEGLVAQGFLSRNRLVDQQRVAADYQSRRAGTQAEIAQTRQRIDELELRARSLQSSFAQQASDELKTTTARVFDLRERLKPALDAGQRQRITAPIDGEVVDLRVHSVGGVLAPRETLMEIVPHDAELVIEARVRPEDIAEVRPGAEADLRLTAFRQRLTPTVRGQVSYVSADRLTDRTTEQPYYLVQVRVDPGALHAAGGLRLQAGMPAEVYIRTSARTAFDYLLDPVLGFLQRTMRER